MKKKVSCQKAGKVWKPLPSGMSVVLTLAMMAIAPIAFAQSYQVNISSKPVDMALLDLAEITGTQIAFESDIAANQIAPTLSGDLSLTGALDKLLQNTGLTYDMRSDNFVVIRRQTTQNTGTLTQNDTSAPTVQTQPMPSPKPTNTGSERPENTDSTGASENQDRSVPAQITRPENTSLNGGEITVTGTRIKNVTPASPVTIISSAEIDARGLSSVEDILRYLPQNYSTITVPSRMIT